MGKISELAWEAFEKTGSIKEYLKYRTKSEKTEDMEAGAEIGAFEDRGNRHKNNKI